MPSFEKHRPVSIGHLATRHSQGRWRAAKRIICLRQEVQRLSQTKSVSAHLVDKDHKVTLMDQKIDGIIQNLDLMMDTLQAILIHLQTTIRTSAPSSASARMPSPPSWTCRPCGARDISGSEDECPHCHEPRDSTTGWYSRQVFVVPGDPPRLPERHDGL